MKRDFLIFAVFLVCAISTTVWGACPYVVPEAYTVDRGNCDTMYVEPWPIDTLVTGSGPYMVRVPIYITADVADDCDSISGFTIPLCYTHSNVSKYCSLNTYWNNSTSFTNARSVFRHIIKDSDTLVYNWMMGLYQRDDGSVWDGIILNTFTDSTGAHNTPGHFWLQLLPTGTEDERFGSGSKVLLVTMTFKLEDTMQICVDSCFWPPNSRLNFTVSDTFQFGACGTAFKKMPRPGTGDPDSFKKCFKVGQAYPHFIMEAIPDSQTIQQGDSAKFDVILTSVSGFSSPCTLTATGLPTNASANFATNPVTPTDTSVMTIKTALTTPIGTHNIWVIAKSGIKDSTKVVLVTSSDVKEIESQDGSQPSVFSLSQNYPNPFNPVTNFQFTVSKSSHVKIDIFNIVGQKVSTLVDKDMKPGVFVADWNGKDEMGNPVSSGIYFYRMRAGDFSDMKKMVLLK